MTCNKCGNKLEYKVSYEGKDYFRCEKCLTQLAIKQKKLTKKYETRNKRKNEV